MQIQRRVTEHGDLNMTLNLESKRSIDLISYQKLESQFIALPVEEAPWQRRKKEGFTEAKQERLLSFSKLGTVTT